MRNMGEIALQGDSMPRYVGAQISMKDTILCAPICFSSLLGFALSFSLFKPEGRPYLFGGCLIVYVISLAICGQEERALSCINSLHSHPTCVERCDYRQPGSTTLLGRALTSQINNDTETYQLEELVPCCRRPERSRRRSDPKPNQSPVPKCLPSGKPKKKSRTLFAPAEPEFLPCISFPLNLLK